MKSSSGIPRYHFSRLSPSLIPEHIVEVEYTTTYIPLPAISTGVNPDGHVAKDGADSTVLGNLNLGRYGTSTKNYKDYAIFIRFEVNIPAGATILGVKIAFQVTGGYSPVGGSLDVLGGFVVPDDNSPSSRNWQAAAGIAAWSSFSDVPMAQSGTSGINYDVFQGSEPAFFVSSVAMVATFLDEYSFGEGVDDMDISSPTTTITPVGNYPGLISQLQDYIDGNEDTLRSSIVTGSIPVLFQLLANFPTGLKFQGLLAQDFLSGGYGPRLIVRYRSSVEPVE